MQGEAGRIRLRLGRLCKTARLSRRDGDSGALDVAAECAILRPISNMDPVMRLALFLLLLVAAPAAAANDAVGRFNVAGYNTRRMCSGTLIRPDLVLTAAHCVARPEDGYALPVRDMVFVAGWNGETHAGAAHVVALQVHPDAFAQGYLDIAHDMALATLAQPLDIKGIALAPPEAVHPDGPFTVLGYRRSRPHRLDVQTGCTGSALGPVWRLGCAVEKGQSGGPVLTDGHLVAVVSASRAGEGLVVPVDDWLRGAIVAAH